MFEYRQSIHNTNTTCFCFVLLSPLLFLSSTHPFPCPLSVKEELGLMGSKSLKIALLAWQGEENCEHKKNISSSMSSPFPTIRPPNSLSMCMLSSTFWLIDFNKMSHAGKTPNDLKNVSLHHSICSQLAIKGLCDSYTILYPRSAATYAILSVTLQSPPCLLSLKSPIFFNDTASIYVIFSS